MFLRITETVAKMACPALIQETLQGITFVVNGNSGLSEEIKQHATDIKEVADCPL